MTPPPVCRADLCGEGYYLGPGQLGSKDCKPADVGAHVQHYIARADAHAALRVVALLEDLAADVFGV
jgi:hypothetical protein